MPAFGAVLGLSSHGLAGEGARATLNLESHSRSDNFLTALAISGSFA